MRLALTPCAASIRYALVGSVLLSGMAFATTPVTSTTPPANIERLIISGSRVVERIDEVTSSVTLIDNATLNQDLKVSSELQNILAMRVPGLAPSSGTSSNAGQTLRGRKALILIDGVPQSTPLRNGSLDMRSVDANAIERIEVIKGATSIYGNGAAGGIINYITKKPGDSKAQVNLGASSKFSTVKFEDSAGYRFNAGVDGSLEKFSYVLNAVTEETGLQRDAEGDVPGLVYGLSETKTQNLFTKLQYQFTDAKSLQFTYNYYEAQQDADLVDVSGSINSGVKTYAIKDTSGMPKLGEPQGPKGNHNVTLKYVDDALLDSTQMVLDAYGQKIDNMFFFSSSLANPSEGYSGGQSIILSEKIGLRANFNTEVDWDNIVTNFVYGVDALQDVSSQPLEDGRIWVPEMDMTNLAFYLQTKWVIFDDWVIKAGVRQDSVDLSVKDYSTLKLCASATQCTESIDVKGGDLGFNATTYNLGLRYTGSRFASPFISYSQGADISDLGLLLRAAAVNDIALIKSQAAIIDNYEIGISGYVDAFSYELAVFFSESELGTSSKYDAVSGAYVPIRAPQEIWGYEAQVSYAWLDNLSTGMSYSFVEGKDTEKDEYLDGQIISPPKFTATLDWQPTDNSNISLAYLYIGDRDRFEPINGAYVGSQGPVEHYNIVNLSSSYQINDWTLSLGVENLFNEDYYSARSQSFTFKGYNTKGLGTTMNVGVSYQF
ncbi:TonB-dependent receptor [Shewanella baltica]|uniref:TonB-dependent receptor n=1 Tax=Shewanella baltica TaxID=62322 RepID=UPI0028720D2D|nr:TonB-dependent receptor [Shewanella baltica]MDR9764943.1 TonB-dependent receptor [Shewanella baltica]